jgi:DNA-3-methyladenine glycosylase
LGARLDRPFFARRTLDVARDLLGCRLVRILDGQRLSGFIIETEAYVGQEDRASHAAGGRTDRNAAMWGAPAHAYVYLIYGVHHCLNIVTEETGFPAAVLIRGLRPAEGIKLMRQNRSGRADSELTDGPGKLCQALQIDLSFNGADLVANDQLFVESGRHPTSTSVRATPRIGVTGDERAITAPWRFVMSSEAADDLV